MTTLKITLGVNAPALTHGADQIPFALARAVNAALVTAQAKQRAHMAAEFTVRRKAFMDRSVKITRFAKKGAPVGEIAIASPGGRDIFEKFERGGTKRPKDGRNLAIPIVGSPVKRTDRAIVQAKNRPRALLDAMQPSQQGVKRAKSFGGAFLRPAKDGKPGAIFMRVGKKVKLAYVLEPTVPIAPELKFEDTITKSVRETFASDFEREFAHALKTARK